MVGFVPDLPDRNARRAGRIVLAIAVVAFNNPPDKIAEVLDIGGGTPDLALGQVFQVVNVEIDPFLAVNHSCMLFGGHQHADNAIARFCHFEDVFVVKL